MRMCRIEDSSSGSYAGRIVPPGIPKMTSVPACSSDRISDWAPVTDSVIGAASASGLGYVSYLAVRLLPATRLALLHLVGVCGQLVHGVVERLLGVDRLLDDHAVVVTGGGHVGLLGVE